MKKVILIILLISFNLFGQEVDFKRVQNSMIIDIVSGDTLSKHSSDTEAQQQLFNWQLKGRKVKMEGAVYEVDVANFNQVTDTIYIGDDWTGLTNMRVIDTIEILASNYGSVRAKSYGVLRSGNILLPIEKDTVLDIPFYTFKAKLERTKKWVEAETSYKLVDIPFHFYKSDSVYGAQGDTIIRIRAFGSKMWGVNHIVDGVKAQGNAEFGTIAMNSGTSTYAGGSFRHTNTVKLPNRTEGHEVIIEAVERETGTPMGRQVFWIPKL